MKALTLWRPWPAAIIHSTKRVENRTWVPPRWQLGKDFALHAGKTVDDSTVEDLISAAMNMDEAGVSPDLLPGPLGIVAVVRLAVHACPDDCGGGDACPYTALHERDRP